MSAEILGRLVRDLRSSLEDESLVPNFLGEIPPHEVPIIYRPPAKMKEPTLPGSGPSATTPKVVGRALAANVSCSLCPERLFPVKKYLRKGKLPVLVLFFNGSVTPTKVRPDRSDVCILASKEEDDFFSQALGLAGFSVSDFYFQQFPACHFNSQRSVMQDWLRRSTNCTQHLIATTEACGIKHVLLSSPSSQFLLGKTESQRLIESGESFQLRVGAQGIEANVFRRMDPKNPVGLDVLRGILDKLKGKFDS